MELRWLIKKDGTRVLQEKISIVKLLHGVFGGPGIWQDIHEVKKEE